MTPEKKKKHDQQLHALGEEVLRIINDLQLNVPPGDVGYGRKRITFPGGEVYNHRGEGRAPGGRDGEGGRRQVSSRIAHATVTEELICQ